MVVIDFTSRRGWLEFAITEMQAWHTDDHAYLKVGPLDDSEWPPDALGCVCYHAPGRRARAWLTAILDDNWTWTTVEER